MAIDPFQPGSLAARNAGNLFVELRANLADLQRQMATGQKADTYGRLGFERRTSLDLHAKLSTLDGYQATIQDASLRLNLMDASLERIAALVQNTKSAAVPGSFDPGSDGRTIAQRTAEEGLKEAIDLLNVDDNGRYLFSGRAADVKPVASYDLILNGDGSHAGLKQLIAERKAADLGSNGLGRLTLSPAAAGVTVSEEAAGLPFGFKISGAAADGSGIVASFTAGPPASAGLALAGQPADGDKVRLVLTLPDGTQQTVELTARTNVSAGAPEDAFAIGASIAATAANLATALTAALGQQAATTLASASAQVAAQDFFAGSPSTPPTRVAGPPFDTATATVAGTASDTVIWYKGDDTAPSARATAPVKLDASQNVGLGAQANEPGLRAALAQFGALAAETFPASDSTSRARYEALAQRVRAGLSAPGSGQSVADIATELATSRVAIDGAKERHMATKALLQDRLDAVEGASNEEVAAAILSLQTRLQASYETTSILSRLSLSNYL